MMKIKIEYEDTVDITNVNNFMKINLDYPLLECRFRILEINDKYERCLKKHNLISGIYRISRKNKSYIGKSIDIFKRWNAHANQSIKSGNFSLFYRTMHKHLDEFVFEIVEIVKDKTVLNEREIYWIDYFNSYENGYNQTRGGDGVGHDFKGEKHHNCKVPEKIVKEIRCRYNDKKETFRDVYKDYKDFMRESTFKKIWNFSTWKHIYPEFNTIENSERHIHHMNFSGNVNPRKILNNKERDKIRELLNTLSGEDIYENCFNDYSKNNFMRQLNEIKQYKTNEEIDFIYNEKFTNSFLKR